MLRSVINKCKGTNCQNIELKKENAKDLSENKIIIIIIRIIENDTVLSSKANFLLTSPSGSGPELILLTQKAFFLV